MAISPLNINVKMVNPDGTPTPEFMRWWQEFLVTLNPLAFPAGVSNLLDVVGLTHGAVLYRAEGLWGTLPPGTAGLALLTQGPDADPSWGLPAMTYLALTDTPSAYAGEALKIARVNAAEDAMEFVAATYLALADTPSAFTGDALKAVRVNAGETALEFYTPSAGASTYLGLTDTPSAFTGDALKAVRVNAGETALEFYTPSAGASTYLGLTDTPAAFTGDALKAVRVNAGETALEFYTPSAGGSTYLGLTDTPSAFTGDALKAVRVNAGETALEFYTPSAGGADVSYVTYGSAYAAQTSTVMSGSSAATKGVVLTSNGDRVFTGGHVLIGADASATYKMVVAKCIDGDATFEIESMIWESDVTAVNNTQRKEVFEAAERIILLATKRYAFLLVRTDGTGSAICELPFTGSALSDPDGHFSAVGSAWLADNAPAPGDALYIATTSTTAWNITTAHLVLEEIYPAITSGDAGKVVGVNAGETAFELLTPSTGGAITIGTEITATRDITNTDLGGGLWYDVNSASDIRLTVPPSLTGTEPMTVQVTGAGEVDFAAGAGVTIHAVSGFLGINGQYAEATLTPKATNIYALTGALKTSGYVAPSVEYFTALPAGYTSVSNVVTNGGANRPYRFAYGALLTGKKYWEVDHGNPSVGNISDSYWGVFGDTDAASHYDVDTTASGLPASPDGFGWRGDGNVYNDASLTTGHITYNATANDERLMFAYDATAEMLWIGVNGTWQGNPSAGTGGFSLSSWASAQGGVRAAICLRRASVAVEVKVTSGTLDYTIPTGFSALT